MSDMMLGVGLSEQRRWWGAEAESVFWVGVKGSRWTNTNGLSLSVMVPAHCLHDPLPLHQSCLDQGCYGLGSVPPPQVHILKS